MFVQDATQSGYKVETFFVPPTFDSDFDLDKFYAVSGILLLNYPVRGG